MTPTHKNSYQTPSGAIIKCLIGSIQIKIPYCVQQKCMWNPFITITPSYHGYYMENKCRMNRDRNEHRTLPTMAIKTIHDNTDLYHRIHLPLPI